MNAPFEALVLIVGCGVAIDNLREEQAVDATMMIVIEVEESP